MATRNFVAALFFLAACSVGGGQASETLRFADASVQGEAIATAFREKKSGVYVTGEGIVAKVLADDKDGSRHQRFLLNLASGQTLLVAHNIDIAARVASLKVGDSVLFKGVYEWNAKGGTVHWTHRDPAGRRPGGWLRHAGQYFE